MSDSAQGSRPAPRRRTAAPRTPLSARLETPLSTGGGAGGAPPLYACLFGDIMRYISEPSLGGGLSEVRFSPPPLSEVRLPPPPNVYLYFPGIRTLWYRYGI